MSDKPELTRNFSTEFRCVLLEQVDAAIGVLQSGDSDSEEAVHELRKRCKEVRSVLRLAREEIPGKIYRRENRFFRDTARRFSDRRDRWVYAETVELVPAPAGMEADEWCREQTDLVSELRSHHEEETPGDVSGSFEEVAGELEEARRRIDDWTRSVMGRGFPRGGLKRIYKRGRKEMEEALARPSTESFHLWRKRAKYLWHHLEFLESIWPEMMKKHASLQHRLSSLLGEEHDLAVLAEFLRETPGAVGRSPDRLEPVIRSIEEARTPRQEESSRLGRLLYAEKPAAFARRLERYADATREDREEGPRG